MILHVDGHQMVNTEIRLIIFFAAKDGEAIYSQQKQDQEADCGSDHELLIAKFRLKLKKAGKATRPFKVKVKSLSRVRLFVTPWTAATRLLCPWDFPGKSTGVGCHCLL